MKNIGFIGIGVMGTSMVRNLKQAGFTLFIYNRTKSKAEALIAEGALWRDTPADCARGQDAVITMVGYPKDVEQVYFGAEGIFSAVKSGCTLIDMSTTSPALAQRIFQTAKERGIQALDAPVSGGEVGARNATLSIMVGGEQAAFDSCMPIFQALGSTINYTGPAGNGQHTKMANQIALAGIMGSLCESLAYAKKNGLDLDGTLACISKGSSGSHHMTTSAPKILNGNLNPGFYIKHYIKDLTIALENVEDTDLDLGVTRLVRDMYSSLDEAGFGDLGTQALIKYYQ